MLLLYLVLNARIAMKLFLTQAIFLRVRKLRLRLSPGKSVTMEVVFVQLTSARPFDARCAACIHARLRCDVRRLSVQVLGRVEDL